jgi:hypothetical protein
MTNIEASTSELADKAYSIAWREFRKIKTSTPDEITFAPRRLRWYVQIMTTVGERDPKKIATAALGMLRQYEQISRPKARVRRHVPLAPAA